MLSSSITMACLLRVNLSICRPGRNSWRERNLPNDTEMIQRSIGRTAPEIMATLLDRYKPGWSATEYNVHDLAQRKNTHYIELAEKSLRVYPGVEDGIRWLHSLKIATAVVSNGRRRELEKTLKHVGLLDLVDPVVSRDDVSAFKPDPTPYLFAAASLGLDTQDCIAVEDSPTGLESALFARVPTAAVMTNFQKSALESPVPGRPDLKPIWVGPSILEFFAWLKTL